MLYDALKSQAPSAPPSKRFRAGASKKQGDPPAAEGDSSFSGADDRVRKDCCICINKVFMERNKFLDRVHERGSDCNVRSNERG